MQIVRAGFDRFAQAFHKGDIVRADRRGRHIGRHVGLGLGLRRTVRAGLFGKGNAILQPQIAVTGRADGAVKREAAPDECNREDPAQCERCSFFGVCRCSAVPERGVCCENAAGNLSPHAICIRRVQNATRKVFVHFA